jgi:hypothetical protein
MVCAAHCRYLIHRKDDSRKVRLVQGTMHVRLLQVDGLGNPIELQAPTDGVPLSPTASQLVNKRHSMLSSLRSLRTLSPEQFPTSLVPPHVQAAAAKNPALLERVRAGALHRRLRPSRAIRRVSDEDSPMPLVDDASLAPLHRFDSLTAGASALAARARRGTSPPVKSPRRGSSSDRSGSPSVVAALASRLSAHVRSPSTGRLRLPPVQFATASPSVSADAAALQPSGLTFPPVFDFASATSSVTGSGSGSGGVGISGSPASAVNVELQPSRLYRGRSTAAGK